VRKHELACRDQHGAIPTRRPGHTPPASDPLALYDAHRDAAYGMAIRVLGGRREDLEDVVSEAFEEACRAVRGGLIVASPRAFVCGITARVCLRHRRRRFRLARALRRLVGLERAEPPERALSRAVEDEAGADRVQRALAELPPAWRAVVVMHHTEDMPVAEIAAALGLREGTVKSRLFRAREALRRALADGGVEA
jgi:RNA polymerase sigma factor (sigma-70 family)